MPKTNETIEAMVRDFTQVQPRSKSEVRERIHNLLATKDAACEERVREAVESKNEAYRERNQLVCALTKLFPSYLARHDESDTTWGKNWMWIVYIELPTGQVSWHIHDSERLDFSHLELRANNWDGHNTERKYQRLAALALLTPPLPDQGDSK